MAQVATTTDIGNLSVNEAAVVAAIRQRNVDIAAGTAKVDFDYPGAAASLGFHGIRSAHGIGSLEVAYQTMNLCTLYAKRAQIGDLYRNDTMAKKKVKLCWMSYAEASATIHAAGKIPTLVEFSGSGGGRIMFEYARDLTFYSPDHYGSYSLVTAGALPLRTM